MSRRPPCHTDADQLRQALGLDELVVLYRLGDQLGYVAVGRDARQTVAARRAGDVAVHSVRVDRGVCDEHGDAADGAPAPAAPAQGGDAGDGHEA